MAKRAKTLDNMQKNLTKAEIEAREAAERELLSCADPLDPMKPPAQILDDKAACEYWKRIITRARDTLVMDTLDTEVLAMYCSQLSRRDVLVAKATTESTELLQLKLEDGVQRIEKSLLGYAKELGLTPSARAGLAKKRAAQEDDDPSADLFG